MPVNFLVVASISCLLLPWAVLEADPLPVYIINEYQTAPDSLERIEFHAFPSPIYENLYGWRIVTRAGTAWISDSIILDSGYVVIDSSNTSGVFDLGDEEDSVFVEGDIYTQIVYPDPDPAPPEGASVSLFFLWCDDLDPIRLDHYIETVPTFGSPNSHYPGCQVSGSVYSANDSLPVEGASVHFRLFDLVILTSPELLLRSEAQVSTDSTGGYWVDSLYPLEYGVLVQAEGWMAQSSALQVRGALHPTHADFYLHGTEIQVEQMEPEIKDGPVVWPNPFHSSLHISSSMGTENLQIFDNEGRLCAEFPAFVAGWNGTDMAGWDLPAGTYFIRTHDGEKLKVKKVVKIR